MQAKESKIDDLACKGIMEQLELHSHTQERQAQDGEAEICCEQIQQDQTQIQQTNQDHEQLLTSHQQSLEQGDEFTHVEEQSLQDKERQIREAKHPVPIKLQWENGPKAPLKTFGVSIGVLGRVAYFYSWKEKKIMTYNSETGKWAILPECPKISISLAVVNGLLTAVGGSQAGYPSKSLLSLTHQETWTEQFPPMTYYHKSPAVACTSTSLIVAGGWGPDEERAAVEVMDIETLCWSVTASLPYPWYSGTATVCRDKLYIAGGFAKDVMTKSVLTCVVSELLQSTATQYSTSEAIPTASDLQPSTDGQTVWQELPELPVYLSALVTLHDQLLAIGGNISSTAINPTSAVYQYSSATNSWNVIRRMNSRRHRCFAAALPNNTLVVAGGWTSRTRYSLSNTMEIASCEDFQE